ncbi:hypothetical protein V6O07_03185, partial [Arthrospira platensis SPKY2]
MEEILFKNKYEISRLKTKEVKKILGKEIKIKNQSRYNNILRIIKIENNNKDIYSNIYTLLEIIFSKREV